MKLEEMVLFKVCGGRWGEKRETFVFKTTIFILRINDLTGSRTAKLNFESSSPTFIGTVP